MAKKEEILTAFAEEMRRHNSVKRRINLIWYIMVSLWVMLFAILSLYLFLCPLVEKPRTLTRSYQFEAP